MISNDNAAVLQRIIKFMQPVPTIKGQQFQKLCFFTSNYIMEMIIFLLPLLN